MDRKSPRTKAKKGMLLIIIAIAAICDGTVKLYDPDGTMIKVKRASEAAEPPVQVEFAARSTGIYTVEVSEIEKGREDAYDVMMYHIKYEHLES